MMKCSPPLPPPYPPPIPLSQNVIEEAWEVVDLNFLDARNKVWERRGATNDD